MTQINDEKVTGPVAHEWLEILDGYRVPSHVRSLFEIAITVIPFVGLWLAAWATLSFSYFLSLAIALPAAGFLVRLFMIQHDCGHGSFFRRRWANDWTGRAMGVLTFTPYAHWQRSHAVHHATSGNLDRRGIGDITTLTVAEYQARSYVRRLAYRLYRHPLIMFGIGPAYLFVVLQRIPMGQLTHWRSWLSPMATNAGIGLLATAVIWFIGAKAFLLVHTPIILLAASIGVWLFYVQHQFEETAWAKDADWTVHEAALHGSSHYDLPAVLQWLTANIGVHHVHHLCSRVPFYRLQRVLREHPKLKHVGRITLRESFACVPLVLWDEQRQRMISFQQLRALSRRHVAVLHSSKSIAKRQAGHG